MEYELRSKEGILKAKLDKSLAIRAMTEPHGKVREAKYKDHTSTVYEFLEDGKYTNQSLCLYIWVGDKIELD